MWGKTKQGACYGHTEKLGYHPLLAIRADTAEIVGARLRAGSSQRGVTHFAAETIRRVRRAGSGGPVTVRADAGFCSYQMFEMLESLDVGWSVTVPKWPNVRRAIAGIDEDDWETIAYPPDGTAQVAETTMWITHRTRRTLRKELRLVVRRARLLDSRQQQLWPNRRHHAFVTNPDPTTAEADQHHHPDGDTPSDPGFSLAETDQHTSEDTSLVETDAYHRRHAVCELAIRDLKHSAGLAHLPSGKFGANAAWLLCAALAHNLYRWIGLLANTSSRGRLTMGQTIRNRLFSISGRLVNHSGRHLLRLPARWPWAQVYLTTLHNLRNLPQLC